LRKDLSEDSKQFLGPIEVDGSCFGGKQKNMPNSKRKELTERGALGKTGVMGAKGRTTNQVAEKVIGSGDADSLQGVVKNNADPEATVYTDDATVYESLPFDPDTVEYLLQKNVKGDVHTNGNESPWSMLKRTLQGTFHQIGSEHLDRYVQELAGRHNMREQDTIGQLRLWRSGMGRRRPTCKALIKDNGYASGARATADGDAQRQEPHSVHWWQPRRDAGFELRVRGPDLAGIAVQSKL